MNGPQRLRRTLRPRKQLLSDDEYHTVLLNHRQNFDSKIADIIQKYSLPDVDNRVVDLRIERFVSSDEEDLPEEPPPCRTDFIPANQPIITPFGDSQSFDPSTRPDINPIHPPAQFPSKPASRVTLAGRAARRCPRVLSFHSRYISTLRKRRWKRLLPTMRHIRKCRATEHDALPETMDKVLRRPTDARSTEKEQPTTATADKTLPICPILGMPTTPSRAVRTATSQPPTGHQMTPSTRLSHTMTSRSPIGKTALTPSRTAVVVTPPPNIVRLMMPPARLDPIVTLGSSIGKTAVTPSRKAKTMASKTSTGDKMVPPARVGHTTTSHSPIGEAALACCRTAQALTSPPNIFHTMVPSGRFGHTKAPSDYIVPAIASSPVIGHDCLGLVTSTLTGAARKPGGLIKDRSFYGASSAWHSTPRQVVRQQVRSECAQSPRHQAQDGYWFDLPSNRNSPIEAMEPPRDIGASSRSSSGASNDESTDEFLLISDLEDLGDSPGSPPRPPAPAPRSRMPARRSLAATWDFRPSVPDCELPDEMFDVVIVDDPKFRSAANRPRPAPRAPAAAKIARGDKTDTAAKLPDEMFDVSIMDDPKVWNTASCAGDPLLEGPQELFLESSDSSESTSCCVLLHYNAGASTKVTRVSGRGFKMFS